MWVGYEEFCRSRLGRGSAWVDNTLRDLQNSSYPMKAELNNCFIIIQNISYFLKEKLSSLFFAWAPKITQPDPQVFSVKGSIICSGLHFRYHFDVSAAGCTFDFIGSMSQKLSKFGQQQLVMVNYIVCMWF